MWQLNTETLEEYLIYEGWVIIKSDVWVKKKVQGLQRMVAVTFYSAKHPVHGSCESCDFGKIKATIHLSLTQTLF